jgi:hypothetical protein
LAARVGFLVDPFLPTLRVPTETDFLASVRPKPPRALAERALEARAGLDALRVGLLEPVLATLRVPVAEADFLTGVRDFLGLVAPIFFLDDAFLPFAGLGFTSASTKAVTALDATSIAASTLALAASPIAACAEGLKIRSSLSPLSLSIVPSQGSNFIIKMQFLSGFTPWALAPRNRDQQTKHRLASHLLRHLIRFGGCLLHTLRRRAPVRPITQKVVGTHNGI